MNKFSNQVYQKLQQVPSGKVTTYGDIARAIGSKAYQAVGQAMKNNPDPKNIPCHRVIKSNGTLGGYFGRQDKAILTKKKNKLQKEGIKFNGDIIVKLNMIKFVYD